MQISTYFQSYKSWISPFSRKRRDERGFSESGQALTDDKDDGKRYTLLRHRLQHTHNNRSRTVKLPAKSVILKPNVAKFNAFAKSYQRTTNFELSTNVCRRFGINVNDKDNFESHQKDNYYQRYVSQMRAWKFPCITSDGKF